MNTRGKNIGNVSNGIIFAGVMALFAWLLGGKFPVVGGPVFAVILGLLMSMIYSNDKLTLGISFTGRKLLQYSIILLGFDMNLYNIIKVGRESLVIILATIATSLIVAYFASRALNIEAKTGILIGVGSSVCGGSAIAATAPVIGAETHNVAKAISTIFFFNLIAALIFPSLGSMLNMTDYGFGLWAGTAINDTSSVVAAATTWSIVAGNDSALKMATIVKLTRTLAIIPITFILGMYTSKVKKKEGKTNGFNMIKIFPWFIVCFLIAAIINTIFHLNTFVVGSLVTGGKFMIVMAMFAIGFGTKIENLIEGGMKPILLGLICWLAVILSSLGAQVLLKVW